VLSTIIHAQQPLNFIGSNNGCPDIDFNGTCDSIQVFYHGDLTFQTYQDILNFVQTFPSVSLVYGNITLLINDGSLLETAPLNQITHLYGKLELNGGQHSLSGFDQLQHVQELLVENWDEINSFDLSGGHFSNLNSCGKIVLDASGLISNSFNNLNECDSIGINTYCQIPTGIFAHYQSTPFQSINGDFFESQIHNCFNSISSLTAFSAFGATINQSFVNVQNCNHVYLNQVTLQSGSFSNTQLSDLWTRGDCEISELLDGLNQARLIEIEATQPYYELNALDSVQYLLFNVLTDETRLEMNSLSNAGYLWIDAIEDSGIYGSSLREQSPLTSLEIYNIDAIFNLYLRNLNITEMNWPSCFQCQSLLVTDSTLFEAGTTFNNVYISELQIEAYKGSSLSFLSQVRSLGSIGIVNSPYLSECSIFSICNLTETSSNSVVLFGNGIGCSSLEEIIDNCTYSYPGPEIGSPCDDNNPCTINDILVNECVCQGTLNLTRMDILASIMEGETYTFNGQSLTTAGTYEAVLVNAAGCDSIVTLTLSVEPALSCDITASSTSICAGESVELSVNGGANTSACASNQLPSNLQNGLVAYYPFCGNANDASGNGNDGNLSSNSPTLTLDRFGNSNSAYQFNVNQLISAPIVNSSVFTAAAWVRFDSYNACTSGGPGSYFISHKSNAYYGNGFGLGQVNGQFSWFNYNTSANNNQQYPGPVDLYRWYFVAETFNSNGAAYLYVDGEKVDSMLIGNIITGGIVYDFKIGGEIDNPTVCWFDGIIDDVFYYHRALDESEIQDLYISTTQLWSIGATTPTITVSPTETTTYSVIVTQGAQTCTSDITITVNQPSSSSIEATITEGESYDFNSQSLTTAGIYEAVLVNAAGCDSTVTLTLSVEPALSCEITASSNSICAGESVELSVNGGANTSACSSNQLPSNLQNGLVAYYPFCGNANDASGNGNDGVVNGAVLSFDRFGNGASAYYFNGVNSRIDLSAINETGDFSISYWEKINETKFSYPVGLGVNTTNFYNGYGIGQSGYTGECAIPANIHFVFDGLTECTNLMYSSSESVSQEWRLVSFTYEQGNSKLYYNGNLVSESTELDYPGFFMLTLGIRSDGAWPFGGWIDDVLVHNRALEMSEIQGLLSDSSIELESALSENDPLASACNSSQLPTNLQNGLIGYYPFCGNANDASGNGNDGEVSGALLSSDRFGNAASAYYFNGVNSRIDLSNINETGDFSITYWEKINQVKFSYPVGLGVNTTNFYNGYGIGQSGYTGECAIPANIHFVFDGLTECTNLMYASAQSVSQQWRLVSFTYEQGNSKLYYNGALVSESSELDYPGFFMLTLGIRSDSAFPFDGWIDDVLVHNRALSATEIQSLNESPTFQVLWSNGATTPSITVAPTETTTYSVTVTEGGQTCTSDVTIEVSPNETYYADADGDGFGNFEMPLTSCDGFVPAGYSLDNSDCNDSDALVYPFAPCDDGDACTLDDAYQLDCTCAGLFADSDGDGTCDENEVCQGTPEPNTACDDNDPCTVNDIIQADCTCFGSIVDEDNDGLCDLFDACVGEEPGTACDDNDLCTVNDIILADCSCAGTFADADNDGTCDANDNCAGSEAGTACDDNDPCTVNDIILADCSCAGTFADADNDGTCDANDNCAGSEAGTACDDNDPCTVGDVILADCSCAGTFADADSDGTCDANDNCAGPEVGSACDDNDACTVNDVILADCSCTGTFADEDNDGTCDANDFCAGPEVGSPCDDNNACTLNDLVNADCVCVGTPVVVAGPQGVSVSSSNICSGTSSTLTVQGALSIGQSWKWYTGSCGGVLVGSGSSISVSPTSTTNYFVRAEGSQCGPSSCASATVTVSTPPAIPQGIVLPPVICRNSPHTISVLSPVAGMSYFWELPNGWTITSGQGTAAIQVMTSQSNGQIRVYASNVCGNSKRYIRSVSPLNCNRSAEFSVEPLRIELWPNPASDIVHFAHGEMTPEHMVIYDTMGRVIYEGNWMNEMDVSALAGGIYFVRATSGGESVVMRMEVAR